MIEYILLIMAGILIGTSLFMLGYRQGVIQATNILYDQLKEIESSLDEDRGKE